MVEPLFVLLMPLRLVRLRLGELLLRSCLCATVFAHEMLAGGRPATCDYEADDDHGYGDQAEDDPREHARSVPCYLRVARQALAGTMRRVVAVGVALADRAVLVVNDMLGPSARARAHRDGLFLVRVAAGDAVTAFDLVLPFAVFPDRVDEAVSHVRLLDRRSWRVFPALMVARRTFDP